LIQAHCSGLLDLATADTTDPRWWQKVWFVFDYVDRENYRKIDEYKYQYNLALLDYHLDDERFNLHRDQAAELRKALIESWLPWADVGPVGLGEYIHSMKVKYAEVFGDEDDPEFQKNLANAVAYLKRSNKE